MGTIVNLRGEGSVVWEFELPLSEVFADQVRTRKLVPVDDDSYAAVADLLDPETEDESAATPAEVPAAPEAPKAPEVPAAPETPETPSGKAPLDLEALGKMKIADLRDVATEVGVDAETVASFTKPGTSKASVIAAIVAADAA